MTRARNSGPVCSRCNRLSASTLWVLPGGSWWQVCGPGRYSCFDALLAEADDAARALNEPEAEETDVRNH